MAAKLPAEILNVIFEYISDDIARDYDTDFPEDVFLLHERSSQSILAGCARVCQRWRKPVERILYRHLSIYDSYRLLSAVLTLDSRRNDLARYVTSLKVRLERRPADFPVDCLGDSLESLPNLRNYILDIRHCTDVYRLRLLPTERWNPLLRQLCLLIGSKRTGQERVQRLSRNRPLPLSIETLMLSGISTGPNALNLPNLRRLAMDQLALTDFSPGEESICPKLEHLVLENPDDVSIRRILTSFGKQIRVLETYFDGLADEESEGIIIDDEVQQCLPKLEELVLSGDFSQHELPHIPKSLKKLRWHGATDASVITSFLDKLCSTSFLPSLTEFPTICMKEEARYRYPGVRKVHLRRATEALFARGIKPPENPCRPAWNEKMIFPRLGTPYVSVSG
ncbi:hypothetical protein P389DRAFT_209827 [Cystobasidium minutum MCA 4210]|uniref:uncharacterized protein n=1 Tax=Cystobasidium minutum MCA 4210 TaxID=1397322 RepID=UPI0034CD938A|eukprot:jgi/Rhomi1/209827/estExt_Genemark1.C_3_t10485